MATLSIFRYGNTVDCEPYDSHKKDPHENGD